jgi:hypothetical protein
MSLRRRCGLCRRSVFRCVRLLPRGNLSDGIRCAMAARLLSLRGDEDRAWVHALLPLGAFWVDVFVIIYQLDIRFVVLNKYLTLQCLMSVSCLTPTRKLLLALSLCAPLVRWPIPSDRVGIEEGIGGGGHEFECLARQSLCMKGQCMAVISLGLMALITTSSVERLTRWLALAGALSCTPCSPGTYSFSTGSVPRHLWCPRGRNGVSRWPFALL